MSQPHPTPASAKSGKRNLYCTSYNDCIGEALRAGWEGFSCEACPLKSRDAAPRAETFARRSASPMEVE